MRRGAKHAANQTATQATTRTARAGALVSVAAVFLALLVMLPACQPKDKDVILATTTSTQDSGLLDTLIPAFEKKTGYKVKTVAVGTGQALSMAARGEADVLLVHSPESELEVVRSGAAIDRRLVMHNDFVLVGPKSDPAKVRGEQSVAAAFRKIANGGCLFLSRGDDSGTNKKELEIWKAAGVAVTPAGGKSPSWYQETGSGMGQTLNVASEKGAYTLTDRGTYLALQKNLALEVLVEGDKTLLNIYHVMRVNPERFPKVNAKGASAFADFITSPEGQRIIADFGKDKYGLPLFFPDAGGPES